MDDIEMHRMDETGNEVRVPMTNDMKKYLEQMKESKKPRQKVLITGANGFVGRATQRLLEQQNIEIVPFDIMKGRDIRDYEQLDWVIKTYGADSILHLAAIARFAEADSNPLLAFETNVIGTQNVVDIASKYHLPLVYASTGSVYMPITQEPPITEDFECKGNSVYGVSKYLGELYVREHTPYIILRYAHLYGREKRGHGLIGGFLDRIQRGLEPELYGGQQSNDFCYIKDIAQANYLALTASWDKWNQVYNIGTGEELSAEQAGKIICELSGYTGTINIKRQRTVDASRFVYNINKADEKLGFKAQYNFRNGLKDMFNE